MLSNFVGAIAFVAMAVAANNLFRAAEASLPRQRRGFVLAVLLTGAALQLALPLAGLFHVPATAGGLDILASAGLLAVPLSFWPLVARLSQGQIRVLNRRLTQRAERAEAVATAARQWLTLAEQSGHVGHWQLALPEERLVWSDEMYRIYGLWREHFKPCLDTALTAFHPSDGKCIARLRQDAASLAENFEVAARLHRPDGEQRHVVLRGWAQRGAAGCVDAVNGTMVDVTEPMRAAALLAPLPEFREIPPEDSLTGLATRAQFDISLGYEFKRGTQPQPTRPGADGDRSFRRLHRISRCAGKRCLPTPYRAGRAKAAPPYR